MHHVAPSSRGSPSLPASPSPAFPPYPAVSANGTPLDASDFLRLPGGITVQVRGAPAPGAGAVHSCVVHSCACVPAHFIQPGWCCAALGGRLVNAGQPAAALLAGSRPTACSALTPAFPASPAWLLQTYPNFRNTGRPSVTITTPQNLRIEAKQRKPLKPAQIADPRCEAPGAAGVLGGLGAGRRAAAGWLGTTAATLGTLPHGRSAAPSPRSALLPVPSSILQMASGWTLSSLCSTPSWA